MHFLPGRARINPDEFLNHDFTTNFVGKKFSQAESTYEQSLALFPQKKPSILTRYFRENGTAVRQFEVEFSFATHSAYAWRNQSILEKPSVSRILASIGPQKKRYGRI